MATMHPGEALLDEMLARDWNLSDLERETGADRDLLRDFIRELADLTPELADQLAKGTGIEASFWASLQVRHDSNEMPMPEPSQRTAPISAR